MYGIFGRIEHTHIYILCDCRISLRITGEASFLLDLHLVDSNCGRLFSLVDHLPGTWFTQITFFYSGRLCQGRILQINRCEK